MAEYAIPVIPEIFPEPTAEPVQPEAPVLRVLPPMPEAEMGIEYVKAVPRNRLQTERAIGRWVCVSLGVTSAIFYTFAGMNWAESQTVVPNAWQIAVLAETGTVAGMIASRLARNQRDYGRLFRRVHR
jgi:hypothetical protein